MSKPARETLKRRRLAQVERRLRNLHVDMLRMLHPYADWQAAWAARRREVERWHGPL